MIMVIMETEKYEDKYQTFLFILFSAYKHCINLLT